MSKINSREDVIDFISSELVVPKSNLKDETSLSHDLGVAGDDGSEFIVSFCEKFEISYEEFDSIKFFGEEASGNIFTMLFELFTSRHLRNSPRITIGDLIASAKIGKLKLSE